MRFSGQRPRARPGTTKSKAQALLLVVVMHPADHRFNLKYPLCNPPHQEPSQKIRHNNTPVASNRYLPSVQAASQPTADCTSIVQPTADCTSIVYCTGATVVRASCAVSARPKQGPPHSEGCDRLFRRRAPCPPGPAGPPRALSEPGRGSGAVRSARPRPRFLAGDARHSHLAVMRGVSTSQ